MFYLVHWLKIAMCKVSSHFAKSYLLFNSAFRQVFPDSLHDETN
jgi:hypothetical protein